MMMKIRSTVLEVQSKRRSLCERGCKGIPEDVGYRFIVILTESQDIYINKEIETNALGPGNCGPDNERLVTNGP